MQVFHLPSPPTSKLLLLLLTNVTVGGPDEAKDTAAAFCCKSNIVNFFSGQPEGRCTAAPFNKLSKSIIQRRELHPVSLDRERYEANIIQWSKLAK